MTYGVASAERSIDDPDPPRWIHGSAAGLQVWSAALDVAIWATLMVEREVRSGPIMLLNKALLGSTSEGAAISWGLALLATCEPGFYVLRVVAG